MKTLHPHQVRAIDMLRDALRRGAKRPMLQLPTGAGKTVVAGQIVANAVEKRKRVIFTVPAISLVDQTVTRFWEQGIRDVGVIQANYPMTATKRPVQVASIQTLARRTIPDADLVIVDEAHRVFDHYQHWMEKWADVPFIGLSATPWTKGLGRLYDTLIVPVRMQDLIDQGYLSRFRIFAPSRPDLTGVRTVAGDYHEGDLSEAMKPITGDVVTTWLERAEDRPTLCFAVDRAHAKHLQERFLAAGLAAGYVDANTDFLERERVRKAFHRGEIRVVCNVGVLTTGVDWDVRCLILARPTKSESLFVQIVGRALRTAEGKADALILDHSDTTLRLGFPTDIHHSKLDDGRMSPKAGRDEEERAPLPKCCPKCAAVKPSGALKCSSCGHSFGRKAAGVEVKDGQLAELTPQSAAKANREVGWQEKAAFMAELQRYAAETNKSPGWCSHKYRAKFGGWPNDPRVKFVAPATYVSPLTLSWIKAQNIRWVKSQEAARRAEAAA